VKRISTGTHAGIAAVVLAVAGTCVALQLRAAQMPHANEQLVFSELLPNVPGNRLSAVVVNYAPGERSPSHAHAGSVFAYVLTGQIRSENSATGPVRVYRAGEGFFEPPGSTHSISANASQTESASLLAIFIAEDGARLTRAIQVMGVRK
jgi:quercetin dioxygenase-like cupin family protein